MTSINVLLEPSEILELLEIGTKVDFVFEGTICHKGEIVDLIHDTRECVILHEGVYYTEFVIFLVKVHRSDIENKLNLTTLEGWA